MKRFKDNKPSKKIGIVLAHIFLVLLAFIWILPIFSMFMTSFRSTQGVYSSTFLPTKISFNSYRKLFTDLTVFNYPKMFVNTCVIASVGAIISTILIISTGYVLSRERFPKRKGVMWLIRIIRYFPFFMIMLAVYYITRLFSWNTGPILRIIMICAYSGGAGISYVYAKEYFDTMPKNLEDAARLEGATKFRIFAGIIMPLSNPIIIYTFVSSFLMTCKDFMLARVLCGAEKNYYTVAVGLYNMLDEEHIDQWFTAFAAGAVLISIPVFILELYASKYNRKCNERMRK